MQQPPVSSNKAATALSFVVGAWLGPVQGPGAYFKLETPGVSAISTVRTAPKYTLRAREKFGSVDDTGTKDFPGTCTGRGECAAVRQHGAGGNIPLRFVGARSGKRSRVSTQRNALLRVAVAGLWRPCRPWLVRKDFQPKNAESARILHGWSVPRARCCNSDSWTG